jgi:hypothetical protein
MRQCNRRRHRQQLGTGVAQQLVADFGMALHLSPLLLGEVGRLEQDPIWNPHLPDVVHRCGDPQELDSLDRQPEFHAQKLG